MGQPCLAPAITIEPATPAQLAELVSIHCAALPETLNSRLGPQHLTYLYTRMLAHPKSLVSVARLDGKVSGVVCATLDLSELSHWLIAELTLNAWIGYALRILTHPSLWFLSLESLGSSQVLRLDGESLPACLTVLAVSPHARRRGLGQALVQAVDDFVRKAGLSGYWLETDASNQGAQAFYSSQGFQLVARRRSALRLLHRL
jgi:ribosomal protein S18 acetylase RimI-like enzyme